MVVEFRVQNGSLAALAKQTEAWNCLFRSAIPYLMSASLSSKHRNVIQLQFIRRHVIIHPSSSSRPFLFTKFFSHHFSLLKPPSLVAAAMAVLLCLFLLLLLTGDSNSTYCVCKDGVSPQAMQKTLDYACGAGADCSQILQNGNCYQPNTVKDHCSYAVNSYFQNKGQAQGSCDFAGTAGHAQTLSSITTGCIYPSGPTSSNGGSTTMTPTTNPSPPTTPITTPSIPPPPPTTTAPTAIPSVFGSGISPTGSGTTTNFNDTGAASPLVLPTNLFHAQALAFLYFSILI